jgi:hypothetical protein
MAKFRSVRWIFPSLLVGLMLAGALLASSAAAAGYGAIAGERFDGAGTGTPKGTKWELEEETTHVFGVDPTENSIFVGDERVQEEEFRLQKYSSAGAFQGKVIIKPKKETLPTGIGNVEDLDGAAVDAVDGRVYVLVTYRRYQADTVDPSVEAAGAVYVYSTTPNASHELVPATGTGINQTTGLLGTTETLKANSETQGQALISPSGIAVNPVTHEVLILGVYDKGSGSIPSYHVGLARLSESGALETPYIDSNTIFSLNEEPNSPVVSGEGKIFFETENAIDQLPSSLTSPPNVVFDFEQPELLEEGPFKEEMLAFGDESPSGAALAIVSEGTKTEGRLVVLLETVAEIEADGEIGAKPFGVLNLHYHEEGESTQVTELGWTGGGTNPNATGSTCSLGDGDPAPIVAAAGGEKDLVLAASDGESNSDSEVLEFGPGGIGCPTAKAAPGGIEPTQDGKKDEAVNTKTAVVLQAKVIQANVESIEWKFGDGSAAKTTVVTPGEQTQTAEVEHKFAEGGDLKVEAVIHTDNLDTPVIAVSSTIDVTESAPVIVKSPSNKTVVEGEAVAFEAEATGATSVQWEESPNDSTWKAVTGETTDKLQLTTTTKAESGTYYRADFANAKGNKEASAAAQLTVNAKSENTGGGNNGEGGNTGGNTGGGTGGNTGGNTGGGTGGGTQQQQTGTNENAATPVKVTTTSVSIPSSGGVSLKVSCPAGVQVCSGTITLKTLTAVSTGGKKKASVLTLATGSFSVTGGQAKTITLHLSAAGRSLLGRSHTLRVKATILAHGATGATSTAQVVITLHAAKSHH